MLVDLRYSLRDTLVSAKLRLVDFFNSFLLRVSTVDIYLPIVL